MGARLLRCTRNDDLSQGCNLIGICCTVMITENGQTSMANRGRAANTRRREMQNSEGGCNPPL